MTAASGWIQQQQGLLGRQRFEFLGQRNFAFLPDYAAAQGSLCQIVRGGFAGLRVAFNEHAFAVGRSERQAVGARSAVGVHQGVGFQLEGPALQHLEKLVGDSRIDLPEAAQGHADLLCVDLFFQPGDIDRCAAKEVVAFAVGAGS